MTTDLETSLVAAIRQGSDSAQLSGRRQGRQMQYWRVWINDPTHSRHNWITVGPALNPATAVEYTEFMQKKQGEPLPQYGKFDGVKNLAQGIDRSEPFNNGTRFNPILRAKGGLGEFPKSQFIAYNWHRNPEFAALAPDEWDLESHVDYICEIDGKPFNSERDLQQYVRAMYPDAASSTMLGNEVGKVLEQAGSKAISGTTLSVEDIITAVNSVNQENMKELVQGLTAALTANNEPPAKTPATKKASE